MEAPVIDTLITAISYALVGALFVANCAFQLTAFWWTRNSGAAMRQLIRPHGGDMIERGSPHPSRDAVITAAAAPRDLTSIKARLAEYAPRAERDMCPLTFERRSEYAPDWMQEGMEGYEGYESVRDVPCIRNRGHEGPCTDARPVLGFPGRAILGAMIEEIEHLRSILPPEKERGQGIVGEGSWAVFAEKVTAERDELREEVAHLRRVVALERADPSAALPGWHWNPHAQYWWSDNGWAVWRAQTSSWSAWLGRPKRDYTDDCPIDLRDSKGFHTIWDAMNAAPKGEAMKTYRIDNADNWAGLGEGLTPEGFLEGLKQDYMALDNLDTVTAESLTEAARKAIEALSYRFERTHIVLLYDEQEQRLYRTREVVKLETEELP